VDAGCGARRAALTRTAKSCGPDAPTLASSWRKSFRWRRWQTSPVTGESTKETVKTIAQGRPGDPGEPVVTNACAFYTTHAAAGATGTRLSLRPHFLRGCSFKPRALCVARAQFVVFSSLTIEQDGRRRVLGHMSEASRVRAHALLEKGCRPAFRRAGLAGELGFEPRQTESESVVLPLHHSPPKWLI
jgi:hypothetical protein